jgi:predicted 3-demethylubiquinone-9 3-methyltransferase (glyoxalase superfamily)
VTQPPAPGIPLAVEFHIDGDRFVGLNERARKDIDMNQTVFQIECADQADVD